MLPTGDESAWLRWLIGGISTIAVGILTGTWAASRKVAEHETRLQTLETFKTEQAIFCAHQKEELLKAIKHEVCVIVRQAVSDAAMTQQAKLGGLDTSVAVLAKSMSMIEKDIGDISDRLNRRMDDRPHGIERRQV